MKTAVFISELLAIAYGIRHWQAGRTKITQSIIPTMIKFRINKIIRIMVSIDFVINSAFGSFTPVFAIFLTDKIQGGSAEVAGFAMASYWLTKSAFQLPIARFLDRTDGERDDFYALIGGYLVGSASIFLFTFASTAMHIYLIQALFGLSMAVAVPAWYGIFTRHIDKGETSFEWSLESVFSIGVATAISGALGGIIATRLGFDVLFTGASILALIGATSLIFLYPHLKPKETKTRAKISATDIKGRQRRHI